MSGFGGIIGTVSGAVIGFTLAGPLGIAAGTAILAGAQIGGVLGGVVDILTADKQQFSGPRLNDLTVQVSTYGVPIPIIYGPENRVSGNVIESTDLIETSTTSSSGGKGGGGTESTEYSYHVHTAIAFAGRECERVGRVWCNSKLIFDHSDSTNFTITSDADGFVATPKSGAVFSVLRFYKGTLTQTPDPTLESIHGAGNVPAYVQTCYMVIDTLQLADFGNALPNVEIELVADTSILRADVIRDIGTRCGTSIVAGSIPGNLRGLAIKQDGPGTAALAPMGIAHDFDIAEQHGQLRAVPRGGQMWASIDIGDLGAHESQAGGVAAGGPSSASGGPGSNAGGRPEPIRFSRDGEHQMPQRAVVNYADPAIDYQANSQAAERIEGDAANNLTTELPLTLTATEARKVADRLLWEAWAGRKTATTAVSDRWIKVDPAKLLALPVAGEAIPHKVTRHLRGANGVSELELRYEDRELYSSDVPAMEGPTPTGTLKLPGTTTWQPMDMPILREIDDDSGFYWAATGSEEGWRGARIHRSTDGGASYSFFSAISRRARIGTVTGAALGNGPARFFDRGNTVRVTLTRSSDTLESVSLTRLLNGANAAWIGPASGIGGEVIQFRDATLVSAGVYDLSFLLRGRLGTEHAISGHGASEVFVLIDTAWGRSDFGLADWNQSRLYKPVSVLTAIDDTASESFTNAGEAKRPYRATHPRGTRDRASSPVVLDLVGSWHRRSRIRGPGLGAGGDPPLGEASEKWEVDILDSPGGTVLRTIETTTNGFTYTEAQQTADGLTPGDQINGVIYQISETRGRGHGRTFLM